uniref:Uncharacterized protein n=1 Tax=Micrurus corallinus TaxID=54390 RepID=A0A2D4GD12_MICCO
MSFLRSGQSKIRNVRTPLFFFLQSFGGHLFIVVKVSHLLVPNNTKIILKKPISECLTFDECSIVVGRQQGEYRAIWKFYNLTSCSRTVLGLYKNSSTGSTFCRGRKEKV